MKPEELKLVVKDRYAEIAASMDSAASCCGPQSTCCGDTYTVMSDDYSGLKGYAPEADLGLGCGLPTEHAGIEKGMTVLDLGSGAGNDVFIAATLTGPEGTVIGVDMTPEMIERANVNKRKLGMAHVDFRFGEIESMPVESDSVDVVISNCVLNLVPGKRQAFAEIARVLKPGGHFCVSDIVLEGEIPASLQQVAELYAGCVSGAIQKPEYLGLISGAGFENVQVVKEKVIDIPDATLQALTASLPESERTMNNARLLSVTVKGWMPK
ncbi:MAG: arsenite methyltransferase [Ignavibacteria bacterium]|nr:arsenite methyltransferase [Ignavibacteria bacterium]